MNKVKMILGVCHCVFLVTLVFVIVILSENRILQEVMAQVETDNNLVILQTQDAGNFIGVKESARVDPNAIQRNFYAFKGIPYAKPPLGELRWQEPEVVDIKTKAKNATAYKPVCSQWSVDKRRVVGSQDCLYLNIFTPYIPSVINRPLVGNVSSWTVLKPNLLPVLVFVHGGEFIADSANPYGPGRFMKENVVLVTFNYRLGVLGFLSTGDENLSGNYGILDQLAALTWVQRNIHRFGGNPTRVAIFGNVDYLLLSPRSKDLFSAAIVTPSSTSVLSPFPGSIEINPVEYTKSVATSVGCTTEDIVQMVGCLKITEIEKLVRIQQRMLKFSSFPNKIGPTVDAAWMEYPVLPDIPQNLFDSGNFSSVPIMLGVSAFEGFNHFAEFYAKMKPERFENVEEFHKQLYSTLQLILAEEGLEFDKIFESVQRYYFGGIRNLANETDRATSQLFRLFGDLTVYSGHRKLLRSLSMNAKAPVFNYVFNYSIDKFPDYLDTKLKKWGQRSTEKSLYDFENPPWKELYYLFDPRDGLNDTDNSTATEVIHSAEDENISEILAKIWISFANYGSPKQAVSKLENFTKWQRIGENNINYYDLRPEPRPMKLDYRKAEAQFWLNTIPQIKELAEKIHTLESFPLLFWIFAGLFGFFLFVCVVLIIFLCYFRANEGNY